MNTSYAAVQRSAYLKTARITRHAGKKPSNAAPARARQNACVSVCKIKYRKSGNRFLISCLSRLQESSSNMPCMISESETEGTIFLCVLLLDERGLKPHDYILDCNCFRTMSAGAGFGGPT